MSGTSLDGLDICYAKFDCNNECWKFDIIYAETIEYSQEWLLKLSEAFHLNAQDLFALHSEYGFYLGHKVNEFISKYSIERVDIIASHGQTIFHQPHRRFTTQIGDGRAIRLITNLPIVYDFRSQDVLMGGNGAPLVPIGDELLFSEYDACLNLGGFTNISMKKEDKRIAFDICPLNVVLNHYAQQLGKNYDDQGNFAKKGKINPSVLQQLNGLDFYRQKPPKSLGMEWTNQHVFPLLKDNPEDCLATFTEHAAIQLAEILTKYHIKKLLVTGGGAYNQFLIERLKSKTSASIIIPNKKIVDFKEALIFALMGVLRWNNRINILSSATGSTHDHSSGIVV
ncbi:MAG: anhydro-N-acetylmuramic acid kinase [Cloacibacterium sp.]|nr:anhydro-N-acetylmuramic acid kinase [Cloacibacterium sp.]